MKNPFQPQVSPGVPSPSTLHTDWELILVLSLSKELRVPPRGVWVGMTSEEGRAQVFQQRLDHPQDCWAPEEARRRTSLTGEPRGKTSKTQSRQEGHRQNLHLGTSKLS